jgi:glycosyltransferase involved in cell wall biosynthesis
VLTTATDPTLPDRALVDDVDVWRVRVDPTRTASKGAAAVRMSMLLARLARRIDVVHLHGFSQKSLLVIAMARVFGKRIVIKLTSVGHDDAVAMRKRGGLSYRMYRSLDRFVGVSPRFAEAHREAGLDSRRFRHVPNGVDVERFRPASADERRAARPALGVPDGPPVVLFVGFFSHEKRPDLLYRAWLRARDRGVDATLVFVGPTTSTYYEIDPEMARTIRADAVRRGVLDRIVFIEQTTSIEHCYRAADILVLPTLREGMPNVVLEAMASGVPPIVTHLPGVTDWIVEHGTGLLVPANDEDALADAMVRLLTDEATRTSMSHAARESITRRFPAARTAELTLALYQDLLTDVSTHGRTPRPPRVP